MRIRTTMLLAILLMLTAINAEILRAQSGTSSALTGTINDATGAVVPNATVKATEVNTGAVRTARSNADGRFLFARSIRGHIGLRWRPKDSDRLSRNPQALQWARPSR